MSEPLLVQLIADYGVGDPAFGEVTQKLHLLDPSLKVVPTSIPRFSTIATGFWTAQYALVHPAPGMVIYTNTAPRKDNKESRQQGEGERLIYAKLTNGIAIVGVHAGYCFSFVKSYIADLHMVNVANKGSQFRSRDFYPEAVAAVARGKLDMLGEKLDPASIPDVPQSHVAWIDGYGNMKTTVRSSAVTYKPGDVLTLTINGISRPALYTDGTFSVREGQLAFAPGSSGGEDRFMEIFLRGLSAHQEFDYPSVETEFTISI